MNQRADFIIPECYIDTNLVETLAFPSGCNHQKGCNQVAKIMQGKFADRFAVGIIDADKRKPGYLNEFIEVVSSKHLTIYRHKSKSHFIILVFPAADGFILSCADVAGIDLTAYGLSSILKEFTAQTKNVLSNKDVRFKRLFRDMENIGEMGVMKKLMIYLASATYKSSDAEIKEIFSSVN